MQIVPAAASEVLFHSLWLLTLVGCVVAFLIGFGLLLKPSIVLAWNRFMSQWISSRQALRALSTPIQTDPWVHRHARLFGALLFSGGTAILIWQLLYFQQARVVFFLSAYFNHDALSLIVDIVHALLVVGSGIGALVGIAIMVNLPVFYWLEQSSGKWFSLRAATKFLDMTRGSGPEHFANVHPRILGIFLVIGSLYIAATFIFLLK